MLLILLQNIDTPEQKNLFESICNDYKNDMYQQAYRILEDVGLAEEAVWTALDRVSRNMHTVEKLTKSKILAYVIIAVKRAAIDKYRQRKRQPEVCELNEEIELLMTNNGNSYYSDVEQEVLDNLESPLGQAIAKLQDNYRDILELKYYIGLHDEEIAKLLGLRLPNVKKRISRAKAKLEEILRKDGYGDRFRK